jgi:hypothetical protein
MADETKQPEAGVVDDETVLKRQYAAACAAIDAAYRQGHILMVMMVFSDGEEPSVFGVEGVPIREMLNWAASTAWELTPERALIAA